MKTLLLTLSLLLGMTFGVAVTEPKPVEYNIGLCSPTEFIVAHATIDSKKLVVSAIATGPDSIQVLKEVAGFDLKSTDKDGYQHFVGTDTEFDVKIKDGHVSGFFIVNGEKTAVLIGGEGKQEKTASDGSDYYTQCEGHRAGDPTDKASN